MIRSHRASRLPLVALAGLLALGVPVAPAQGSDVAGRRADGIFTFDGRGFGHGRGMSQYGAYGAALQGLSHAQILAFYYAGTELGTAPDAQRRVLLTGEDTDAVVTNTAGLAVRDEATGTVTVTGDRSDWSQLRARPEGTLVAVEALQGASWVAVMPPVSGPIRFEGSTLQLHHPAGLRTYRGTLSAALSGQPDKPLYVVSTVGLDDYVRGVVPVEMPASWPAEALKAQAVAARSYGLQPCPQRTAYPATGLYDVVDTTACQVYGGAGAETASTDQAVAATAGQVLRYDGAVLRTEFSSSNGGWTVANGGAFVAKQDPYDEVGAQAGRSSVHRWTGVQVPAARIEQAFGTGVLRDIRVLARDGNGEWGGRVLRVRLVGDTQTVEVTGNQLRSATGLRSSWFDLVSPIDSKHAALGGDRGLLGPAIGAEAELAGGRFRPYRAGSIYWTPVAGAFEAHGAVRDRWGTLGWENGPLGFPVSDELPAPDGSGRYNHFQGGSIYWTPGTGAWAVQGAIRDAWRDLGWERSALGYPTTSEQVTPDSSGRYNNFQGGSLYWSPSTGAFEVRGSIRATWSGLGGQAGPLGYPLTHERLAPDGRGRYNHFQGGSIYWSPATGAYDVRGSLRDTWSALGWELGPLGYPTTGERVAPDGVGRYNHFQGGSIYWSPATGAYAVQGAIRQRWASLAWEAGPLGYPTSNEYDVPGGRRSDFQRGSISWDARTGATTVS